MKKYLKWGMVAAIVAGASVFGYYGYFAYENELTERARRIYEGD